LEVLPTLVTDISEVVVILPDQIRDQVVKFEVLNLNGQVLQGTVTESGQYRSLNVEGLGTGIYLIHALAGNTNLMGRFVVAK
jgi:acetoacetate decarboxylase